ncbi:hypothetical protein ES288_D04G082000v1 [Gossypium darwinii]|uniref:Uncharacterized protein n=2 Tax=Gossypium TaxID=3633 RepID=A0A5D2LAU2_GOSTO|nr:hypothetical protein ES288_D04G082000v1 [Gossypium darwinii]TYH76387.1 hypothetical protein ES332_D04G082300v1 [Gossypium tomentosum]
MRSSISLPECMHKPQQQNGMQSPLLKLLARPEPRLCHYEQPFPMLIGTFHDYRPCRS